MNKLIDIVNKILRQHIFVVVDFPSLEEIQSRYFQYTSQFDDYPAFITFDPEIWAMLCSQPNIKAILTEHNKIMNMQVVLILNIDTYILPFDDKLQRALNHAE